MNEFASWHEHILPQEIRDVTRGMEHIMENHPRYTIVELRDRLISGDFHGMEYKERNPLPGPEFVGCLLGTVLIAENPSITQEEISRIVYGDRDNLPMLMYPHEASDNDAIALCGVIRPGDTTSDRWESALLVSIINRWLTFHPE